MIGCAMTPGRPLSRRFRNGRAPVAMPVSWDDLRLLNRANGFGMKDALSHDGTVLDKTAPGSITESAAARVSDTLAGA